MAAGDSATGGASGCLAVAARFNAAERAALGAARLGERYNRRPETGRDGSTRTARAARPRPKRSEPTGKRDGVELARSRTWLNEAASRQLPEVAKPGSRRSSKPIRRDRRAGLGAASGKTRMRYHRFERCPRGHDVRHLTGPVAARGGFEQRLCDERRLFAPAATTAAPKSRDSRSAIEGEMSQFGGSAFRNPQC